MERVKRELEQLLREQFPGAELKITVSRIGRNVGGIVAWTGFSEMEPVDRQQLLWNAIRSQFNQDDQKRISALIGFAPAEYAVMREPQPA